MHKTSLLIAFAFSLFIIGVTLNSCGDKEDKVVATCTDGILNQGEEDIDCGGPCSPCIFDPSMTAKVSGYSWTANTLIATQNGGKLIVTADNGVTPFWMIIMVHNGPQQPGTYALSSETMLLNMNSKEFNLQTGSITFSKFNTISKTVSGTFTFTAKNPGETLIINVTEGSFKDLSY